MSCYVEDKGLKLILKMGAILNFYDFFIKESDYNLLTQKLKFYYHYPNQNLSDQMDIVENFDFGKIPTKYVKLLLKKHHFEIRKP